MPRKKKEDIEKVKWNYSVDYDKFTHTTREADPDDSWDQGDDASEYELKHIEAREVLETYRYNSDIVSDTVKPYSTDAYVVYVVYTTGCTFGTSEGGVIDFMKITTDEKEAQAMYDSIYNGTYEGYKAWEGYFESLDFVRIEHLPIVRFPNNSK